MSKMTLKTEGETHVVVTRHFAAPPEAVYRAHTDPKLVQQWLLGPEGWTMPVCVSEARPGGVSRKPALVTPSSNLSEYIHPSSMT